MLQRGSAFLGFPTCDREQLAFILREAAKISNSWEPHHAAHSSWKQAAIILPKLDTNEVATSGNFPPVLQYRKESGFELFSFGFLFVQINMISDGSTNQAVDTIVTVLWDLMSSGACLSAVQTWVSCHGYRVTGW